DGLLDASDSVGSGRLTRTWQAAGYSHLTVLPSHSFIPRYPGATPAIPARSESYACELWATRLGLLDVLASLNVTDMLNALRAPSAHAPDRSTGVNVVMLTVRVDQLMRDLVDALVRSAERYPDLRVTIADGS